MDSKHFADNTLEERIEIFREYFDRDVEGFFTSSIICCDRCYPEFAEAWPGTAAHDERLQANRMDIDYFLANSRIQDDFLPGEIAALRQHLECPNCEETLDGGFWIYEHRIDIPDAFRRDLHEIQQIAVRSPFLLLTHPFARRVFDTIAAYGAASVVESVQGAFFRCRVGASLPTPELADFGPPPAGRVAEGRYNHAGQSMLYLAIARATALAEVGVVGQHLHVAELAVDAPLRVLDLRVQEDADDEEAPLIQLLARSALLSAPRKADGWDRPEYVFSRFVADCARHAGYDGIRYGSTKDPFGENLVLLEPGDIAAYVVFKGCDLVDAPVGSSGPA